MSTEIQGEGAGWIPRWKENLSKWVDWKVAALVFVALVSLPAWFALKSAAKPPAETVQLLTVAAVRATREDLSREQVFDAEFRPFEEIEIFAKVAGFVETISVDVGDRVKAGQLLATLEVPELNDDLERARAVAKRSQAEVKKSQAAYEEAHLGYTRLAAVIKAQPHLVAQQDIDLAQAKDRAAESGLEAATQQVLVAGAEVKRLQTMMKYSQITAPFNGVITRRSTDPGALIQASGAQSSSLLRLSQNDHLRLVFPVSISFVALIKTNEPVEVRVPSLAKTLLGTISRFTRKIETSTRTMDVEADVPNADLALIPGMYASVALKLEHREKALVVPVEAVSRQKSSTVFLINKENKIEERTIKLGLETPAKLEVLAGLTDNDLVMIGSRTQVKPGQQVEPKMLEAKNFE